MAVDPDGSPLSAAAGGAASEPEDIPPLPEAGGAPSEPEGPSEPEVPSTPEGDCSEPPLARRAELLWRRDVDYFYGLAGPGLLGYSPDGAQIVTPADQYVMQGYSVIRASDATELETAQVVLFGRDATWTHELRGDGEPYRFDGIGVFERAGGTRLFGLGEALETARISGDGRYVAALKCGDVPRVERYSVSDGSVFSMPVSEAQSPCAVSYYGYHGLQSLSLPVSFGFSGSSMAYSIDGRDRVAVVDAGTGGVSEHRLGLVGESSLPADALVTLALSPSEALLATVANHTLRVSHRDGLTPALPDLPAGVTLAFTNCYCEPRYFSPVAWSADGRSLAAVDPDLAVVIRRSCDGAPIARIENSWAAPKLDEIPGPALIAFSPDGASIAVYSFDADFGAALSVYRLEP